MHISISLGLLVGSAIVSALEAPSICMLSPSTSIAAGDNLTAK